MFAFPYVLKKAKKNIKLPNIKNIFGKKLPNIMYAHGYIYNNKNKLTLKINLNKHNVEDVITYNKDKEKKPIKRNFVVVKENFALISSIKERFKKEFPNKNNYINCEVPDNFNYEIFINKIKNSPFLSEKNNLGLTWLLKNHDAILAGLYDPFITKTRLPESTPNDFSERTYTKEFLDNLYDEL